MDSASLLLAYSDMGILAAVVGLYAVLAGLWLVYWVFQRASGIRENRRSERLRSQTLREIQARHEGRVERRQQAGELARQPAAEVDEMAELRAEIISLREAASKAKSRAAKLEDKVEALQLRVADLEREEELSEAESDEAAQILSLYEPHLQKYDSAWATTDPDLGVVLAKRPEQPDDLTRIRGIGAVNQERLNENGVFYFQQIADWTDHNVDQYNALLAFKGRIEREDWVGQAKRLVSPDVQRSVA